MNVISLRPSALRVPTVALTVEVVCADGHAYRGRVFLPAMSAHHSGPPSVEEWLNDTPTFFPFMPSDAHGCVILNKDDVAVVSVELASDVARERHGPSRTVSVACRGKTVVGTVVVDTCAEASRMLDFLNLAGAFVVIDEGRTRHVVRKAGIMRVVEEQPG